MEGRSHEGVQGRSISTGTSKCKGPVQFRKIKEADVAGVQGARKSGKKEVRRQLGVQSQMVS